MKFTACTGLLFACLLPCAALADDAPATTGQGLTDQVGQYLQGQSILLGASYSQGTFKMSNGGTKSQLTDNGRATAIVDYTSAEHVLGKMGMKYGDAVLGLNFGGSFGQVNVDKQLNPLSSAIIGQNLGSKVTGDYLAAAPFVYMRLGPLYPGTDSYWLVGYGLGGALFHFSGNPLFYTQTAPNTFLVTSEPISSTTKLFLYQTWRWQFHYGNWDVLFTAKQISNRQVMGFNTSYEDYGIGVAYNIHF